MHVYICLTKIESNRVSSVFLCVSRCPHLSEQVCYCCCLLLSSVEWATSGIQDSLKRTSLKPQWKSGKAQSWFESVRVWEFSHSQCNIHVFTQLTSDISKHKLMGGFVNTSVLVNSFGAKEYHNPNKKFKAHTQNSWGRNDINDIVFYQMLFLCFKCNGYSFLKAVAFMKGTQ